MTEIERYILKSKNKGSYITINTVNFLDKPMLLSVGLDATREKAIRWIMRFPHGGADQAEVYTPEGQLTFSVRYTYDHSYIRPEAN